MFSMSLCCFSPYLFISFSLVILGFIRSLVLRGLPRRSFLGQVVEAKLKFWAYAWMVHLANSLVGRAPGIRVWACE